LDYIRKVHNFDRLFSLPLAVDLQKNAERTPSLSPFPSPPLRSSPLNPVSGSGERCKLPSRVWSGAPAEIEFGAFYLKI